MSLEIDQIISFFFYFVIFTYHGSRVNDDGFKENNRQLEEATQKLFSVAKMQPHGKTPQQLNKSQLVLKYSKDEPTPQS